MSHLRIVQDTIMGGLESYIVLEDDAVFQPWAVEMLARLLRGVPEDWDQLYLGGPHLKEPEPVAGKLFLRCRNVNRTHGFLLRRRAFVKFQQHIMHAPDYLAHPGFHIDHQLGIAHERVDWKVYAPARWICGQEAGERNIGGRMNPRLCWHPGRYSRLLPYTLVPSAAGEASAARPTATCTAGGNAPKEASKTDASRRRSPNRSGWREAAPTRS